MVASNRRSPSARTTSAKNARLSGKIVVHQCPGDARPFGDLVDADLVVGTLAEHHGAQGEQLGAPVAGGQPPALR